MTNMFAAFKPSDLVYCRSTSQVESTNKQVNRLTYEVTRQGPELAHKRAFLRIIRLNRAKDRKLKHLLNIAKPLKDEWWIHEALLELNGGLGEYKGSVFPLKLPTGYTEPQGVEFARFTQWKAVDAEIQKFLDATSNPASQPTKNPLGLQDHTMQSPSELLQDHTMQSPLLESNRLQSSWDKMNAIFPSAGIPKPQMLGRTTQPDYGFPATQWSRKLTGFDPSSLFNTFLQDSHVMSEFQQSHFSAVVRASYVVNQNASPDMLEDTIADAWNQRHVHMAAGGNPGLGGLLRKRKVHSILKRCKQEVHSQQLQAASRKPPTKPQPKPKVKYVVGVANAQTGKLADGREFTSTLMGDALRKTNQGIPNQKEARRQNLLKFFVAAKKDTKIAFWS
jgi:hypothetical protein